MALGETTPFAKDDEDDEIVPSWRSFCAAFFSLFSFFLSVVSSSVGEVEGWGFWWECRGGIEEEEEEEEEEVCDGAWPRARFSSFRHWRKRV